MNHCKPCCQLIPFIARLCNTKGPTCPNVRNNQGDKQKWMHFRACETAIHVTPCIYRTGAPAKTSDEKIHTETRYRKNTPSRRQEGGPGGSTKGALCKVSLGYDRLVVEALAGLLTVAKRRPKTKRGFIAMHSVKANYSAFRWGECTIVQRCRAGNASGPQYFFQKIAIFKNLITLNKNVLGRTVKGKVSGRIISDKRKEHIRILSRTFKNCILDKFVFVLSQWLKWPNYPDGDNVILVRNNPGYFE